MLTIFDILNKNRIIPVIVIDRVEHAIPLAEVLINAGFSVLEITLRTACALKSIQQIVNKIPNIIVGAGTIIDQEQLLQAKAAGAQFAVSPGLSKALVLKAKEENIPYLPGIATTSEALLAYELDLTQVKFFPAESLGGTKTLAAISEVIPSLRFCPTGGVNLKNLLDYLKLSSVPCVGGTWIAPRPLIKTGSFEKISSLAKETQEALSKQ